MFIDTHAHYDDQKFSEDRDHLLNILNVSGIECIINPGCDLESSRFAVYLSEKYGFIYSAVGIHPENLPEKDQLQNEMAAVLSMTSHPKCCAIGEIGLDYYWRTDNKDDQKKVFRAQMDFAHQNHIPVIIHDREAHADCLEIVSAYPGIRGVFHCFSGSAEMAEQLLKDGWYLGFDGPITYKNARKAIEVLEICPMDRILLETDSPYLPPVPMRGTRNDSGNLRYIAEKISEIKKVSLNKVAEYSSANAKRLFQITF